MAWVWVVTASSVVVIMAMGIIGYVVQPRAGWRIGWGQ